MNVGELCCRLPGRRLSFHRASFSSICRHWYRWLTSKSLNRMTEAGVAGAVGDTAFRGAPVHRSDVWQRKMQAGPECCVAGGLTNPHQERWGLAKNATRGTEQAKILRVDGDGDEFHGMLFLSQK